MRLRISQDEATADSLRGYATINGVIQFDTPVTYQKSVTYRAMEDVVTPKHKEIIAAGNILNNRMLSQTYLYACKPAYVTTTGKISGYDALQSYPIGLAGVVFELPEEVIPKQFRIFTNEEERYNVFLSEYSSERDIAIAKAWSNISRNEMQILASLGELPETLSWIKSIFTRLIKVIRGLRNLKSMISLADDLRKAGKARKADKILQRVSDKIDKSSSKVGTLATPVDLWLEYRYAIRPLVFEMISALKALKTVIKKGTRFTSRGFHEEQRYEVTNYLASNGWVEFNRRVAITRRSNYRAGVLANIDEDINDILAIWGFDQPLQSIYELIPFSFIVDWFFNVGTIIGAWSPKASLSVLSSWIVEQHYLKTVITLDQFTPLPLIPDTNYWNYVAVNTDNYYEWGTTIKRRIPTPDRPILPSFNLRLDMAKIADLAAIGYSLFMGTSGAKAAKRS